MAAQGIDETERERGLMKDTHGISNSICILRSFEN